MHCTARVSRSGDAFRCARPLNCYPALAPFLDLPLCGACAQTVAELLLLAESDVLVLSTSRYATAALLLCARCRQALFVSTDKLCARSPAGAVWYAASPTRPLSCVGPRGGFSAIELMDARGEIESDVPHFLKTDF